MYRAGLAGDAHLRDLMFLNKRTRILSAQKFLQKTSHFPGKKKSGGVSHQRAHLEETVGNGSVNHKPSVTTKPA